MKELAIAYNALAAIKARLEGDWDHPSLIEWGYLDVDPEHDIKTIVEITLQKLNEYGKSTNNPRIA